jgi:hypothetical protein
MALGRPRDGTGPAAQRGTGPEMRKPGPPVGSGLDATADGTGTLVGLRRYSSGAARVLRGYSHGLYGYSAGTHMDCTGTGTALQGALGVL